MSCAATGFEPFAPVTTKSTWTRVNWTSGLCVLTSTTKPAAGGAFYISVVAITTARESSRSRVTATLDAPGQDTKPRKLDAVDVGFSVAYRGFEVRVTRIDPISATFLIARA